MPDYPILSVAPSSMKRIPEDSTIKGDFEAGYVPTRSRHTRERLTIEIGYLLITDTDKILLEAFSSTVKGGTLSFNWTDPKTSVVYIVRFDKAPVLIYIKFNQWTTSFILVEV